MALFASIKNTLENNVELLRNEQGFFADVAYAVNKTVADLTPDTTYGSRSDHFKLVAQSLGETLKAAGGGIKHNLWDEKNNFVTAVIEKSGVQNPLGQAGLATFYTGLYYLKAFTYDAVVNTAEGFYQSGQAIANADNTEEALMGVGQLYGSMGATAGMVTGAVAASKIASKIGNIPLGFPIPAGDQLVFAGVNIPVGQIAGVATAGAPSSFAMAAMEGTSGGGGETTANDLTKEEAGVLFEEEVEHIKKIDDGQWAIVPKNIPTAGEILYMTVRRIDSLPNRLSRASPSEAAVVEKVIGHPVSHVYKGPKVSVKLSVGQATVKAGNAIEWYVIDKNGDLFLIKIGKERIPLYKSVTGEPVSFSWRDFFGH